jgi:hypothetical protein
MDNPHSTAGGSSMGGFNPAWFVAVGMAAVLGLVSATDISVFKKWVLRSVAFVCFVVGGIGLINDFHAAYEWQLPFVRRVQKGVGATTLPRSPLERRVPTACPSIVPPPHQVTAEQVVQFLRGLGWLQGKVKVRISAPIERRAFREQIVDLFELPDSLIVRDNSPGAGYMQFDQTPYTVGRHSLTGTPRFSGFEIIDDASDSIVPTPNPDADATPTPTIHWPSETTFHGNQSNPNFPVLWTLWTNMGLLATRGYSLPAGAPPDEIYIQIGAGPLW